jgi:RNA polymerase sigma-70 factor (ECF subfamily)
MSQVHELVDDLFRHSAGRMVATLTRIFGVEHIDLAEDVVQEALLTALRRWPLGGVPDDPRAWLVRVAKNFALDHVRRDASLRSKEAEIRAWVETALENSARGEHEPAHGAISDDQLAMIFACCHPALASEMRTALTLKTLCGFGTAEIARAFVTQESTIAQRLVRAKKKLAEEQIAIVIPSPRELPQRLDSVLEVLYLMFNEGFYAHQGPDLIRADLVREALRLTGRLLDEPATRAPKVHALLALMLLQGARLDARSDDSGLPLLLEEQDRSRWNRDMLARGFEQLRLAAAGDELSDLHLEAGIASCHAAAPSFELTDWRRILDFYDILVARNASPIIALNRAVAVAMVHGDERGLSALDALDRDATLRGYYLLPALRGEFLRRLGRFDEAQACLREALELVRAEPEREFLRRRLATCRAPRG